MNLTTLVSEMESKVRFLNRTQNLLNSERRQRIRTAEVQSALFVKTMLARYFQGQERARKADRHLQLH